MKKLLATLAFGFLAFTGSSALAQSVSVAPTCSSQTLPVGYNNGTLVVQQNGDLCTNASGGGGGSTQVKATAAPPTWVEGSSNQPSGNLHGGQRMVPMTPGGADFDLSLPAGILGGDGTTLASSSNPFPVTQSSVAQGSTTSGQSGPLVQGAVTTSAPTYTTGQTAPVSLTPAGEVRVNCTGCSAAANVTATGNVASGATDSGNPVKVGGIYNSTQYTLTNGQRGDVQLSSRGEIMVSPCTNAICGSFNSGPADGVSNSTSVMNTRNFIQLYNGTSWDRFKSIGGSFGSATGVAAVETAGASYSHISTNATTTAKSGAGILHKICVNTKGASANTATIYDNTAGSGTVIGVLDTTSGVACQIYDISFATGLTIVTATGTAPDLTVSYR